MSEALVPAAVWWPLAALSAILARPVRGPGELAGAQFPARRCGVELLVGLDARDRLWDVYATDRSAQVRSALCGLPGLPRRVARKLAVDTSLIRYLCANPGLPASLLEEFAGRAPGGDALVALAANPSWPGARRLQIPSPQSSRQIRDTLSVAYAGPFGLLAYEHYADRLVSAFLANPATPPEDIAYVLGRASDWDLLNAVDDIVVSPNVPAGVLQRVVELLIKYRHRARSEVLTAVAFHPSVSPDTLRRMDAVPAFQAAIAPAPKLPADIVGVYVRRLSRHPGGDVVGVLRNPQVTAADALAWLDRSPLVVPAALGNPHLTLADLAEIALARAGDAAASQAHQMLVGLRWWPTVDAWPPAGVDFTSPVVIAPLGAPDIPAGALPALLELACELDPQRAVTAARCL